MERGRPKRFGRLQGRQDPPSKLGRAFTTLSLSKLAEYLAEHKHIKISAESVRRILSPGAVGATYNRIRGVRQMFGALDLATRLDVLPVP
ncbi:hypothetical protein [Kribbella antibiotica]|uniref:hypothetical protein n=1 Tax=Kribbella antibiotica TaxID=190195 RepID=UPI00192E1CAB|nr:hypothetical protein [Kribbella antibiotica]